MNKKPGETWDKKVCVADGCSTKGIYAPTVYLYANRSLGEHPPAIMEIDFLLCSKHKQSVQTLEDLLTDDSIENIAKKFIKVGKAPPDYSRTRIRWRQGLASEIMPRGH